MGWWKHFKPGYINLSDQPKCPKTATKAFWFQSQVSLVYYWKSERNHDFKFVKEKTFLCNWELSVPDSFKILLEFYFEEMKYLQHFLYKNKFDWSFDPSPDISEVFSICTLWSISNNLIWKSTFLIMFVWSGLWLESFDQSPDISEVFSIHCNPKTEISFEMSNKLFMFVWSVVCPYFVPYGGWWFVALPLQKQVWLMLWPVAR